MNPTANESPVAAHEPTESVFEQAAEWIVRLQDVSVTEQDFIDWQAWVAEHASHARAFHEVQETWNRSASVMRSGALDLASLRADINHLGSSRRHKRMQAVRWTALAAVVLGAAVGVASWWRPANTVQTGTAELRSVRLSDGSRISLGPETQLTIEFSQRARLVEMKSGEAYFDVAHAPARPFAVLTRRGRIVAVGTAFTVNAMDDRVAVSVTQGTVRLESVGVAADFPTGSGQILLAAGERFVRDRTAARLEHLESRADALSWQSGRLEYQSELLRVVVADINRYSPVKVRIATAELGELHYTGTVFPDALDAWVASLNGVFPVEVERRSDNTVIIHAKPSDQAPR